MWSSALILIIAFCGEPASVPSAAPGAADDPFRAAALAPSDITLLVHAENAVAIRREMADRPIAHWFDALSETSEAARVWRQLADRSDIPTDDLFDMVFGSRATLMSRGHGEWIFITELPHEHAGQLLTRLNPIVRGPRFGVALFELPEHELLIAQRHHGSPPTNVTLIVGPKTRPQLFEQVLSNMQQVTGATLADDEAVKQAATLGAAHLALLIKHDPPMGGWSAAVANLVGDELRIRQRGSYDASPFHRTASQTRVDASILTNFEDHALIAIIEPTDVGAGLPSAFIKASLGKQLLTDSMAGNLCKRRIIVVGEIEGRQEPQPVDIQATTLALCMELKDSARGERQFDRQMVSLARRIDELGRGAFDIQVPCPTTFEPGVVRTIDISPAASWLTGALPLAKPVTLNWTVITNADMNDDADDQQAEQTGGWIVLATHPQQLRDSVRALQRPRRTGDERQAQSCGFASGSRIGQHLRSWSDRPDLFVGKDDQDLQDDLRASLLMMSKLASGFDRARWRLNRPSANEMCLELTLKLAPPESARE